MNAEILPVGAPLGAIPPSLGSTPFAPRGAPAHHAIAAVFFAFSTLTFAQDQAPESASGLLKKQGVTFTREAVAAANPLAAEAGATILKQGGNAVDAMIATQLVLGLVEPQSSGLGGGAFLLVHDGKRSKLTTYDGRETAPATATPNLFMASDGLPMKFFDAVVGGKSVGVPATVALMAMAHKQHGKLPWSVLFKPAIMLAEQGFPFSARLYAQVAEERFLKLDPASRAYFYNPVGEPWPVGHLLKNQAYADTLKAIAQRGESAFYSGEIAADIVKAVRTHANPGELTLADLAAYRVIEREPVCGGYRGLSVCGMGAPSSGGVAVAQILAYVERHPLARWGPNSVDSLHVISEAGRLAFADRNRYLADPEFVTQPMRLLASDYLKSRGDLIDLKRSMKRAEPGSPDAAKTALADDRSLELPSTSHISIVDRDGNAVSMTTTIENQFGARVMVRGFLLNNELTDFSMLPQENGAPVANRVQGGKRPRSSMSPTIIYDKSGQPIIITGSPGGSAIINYVAKSIVALVDWNLSPQAAAALPNFGSRNGPTELEQGTSLVAMKPELERRGHVVNVMEFTSGLHILKRDNGEKTSAWQGGADPRREGVVAGE